MSLGQKLGLLSAPPASLGTCRRDELSVYVACLCPVGFMVREAQRPALWKPELADAAVAAGHVPQPIRTEDPLPKVAGVASLHRQLEVSDSRIEPIEQPI